MKNQYKSCLNSEGLGESHVLSVIVQRSDLDTSSWILGIHYLIVTEVDADVTRLPQDVTHLQAARGHLSHSTWQGTSVSGTNVNTGRLVSSLDETGAIEARAHSLVGILTVARTDLTSGPVGSSGSSVHRIGELLRFESWEANGRTHLTRRTHVATSTTTTCSVSSDSIGGGGGGGGNLLLSLEATLDT